MSTHIITDGNGNSPQLSPKERIAHAAANWVRMDVPLRFLHKGKEINDPRTLAERKDAVATYFALKQHQEELTLSVVTGPESGILAIDAYTYEPGVGMEVLEDLGFFCKCCSADALIRHECFTGDVPHARFHTLLVYAGNEQFLESAPDELPGVIIRKSGERIILPPSEIRLDTEKCITLRSSYEVDGSVAPAGIAYLPDGLRTIIRKAERQQLMRKEPSFTRKKGVGSELFSVITEGARNTELTRRAGYLIGHKKLNPNDAFYALLDINQRCCIPPLDTKEVHHIIRSIHKRHLRHG